MSKVFISGAITGVDNYMDSFMAAEQKLTAEGYTVINPAKVLENMPDDTSWSEYMVLTLMMLAMADSIYMLKGWERSKGARIEHLEAVKSNMNILYQ